MSTEATFTRGATFAGAEFAEHAYSMGKRSPTRALGSVSVRRAGVSSNGVTFARTRGSKYAGNLRAEDLALALLNFGSIPSKRITRPILRPEPQHARWPYNIPGVRAPARCARCTSVASSSPVSIASSTPRRRAATSPACRSGSPVTSNSSVAGRSRLRCSPLVKQSHRSRAPGLGPEVAT
jgi:hypothetical protein